MEYTQILNKIKKATRTGLMSGVLYATSLLSTGCYVNYEKPRQMTDEEIRTVAMFNAQKIEEELAKETPRERYFNEHGIEEIRAANVVLPILAFAWLGLRKTRTRTELSTADFFYALGQVI